MSIQTSTFGGVRLSGKDADEFERVIKHGKPKKAAIESAKRGKALAKEYNAKGYVTVQARSRKK